MDTDDEAAGRLRSTDLHRIIVAALEGHEKKPIHYHALLLTWQIIPMKI